MEKTIREKTIRGLLLLLVLTISGLAVTSTVAAQIPPPKDEPKMIDPGPPGGPPADAIVLFDGKDLSQWKAQDGGPAKWDVTDGVMVVKRGTGQISSK